MSLTNLTSLGSNSASVTDLKRIQTPHSLCYDFGGYKTFTTHWSGGTFQVWVQVRAPAGHLAICLKAVPEGNQRFRGQNQRPSSWGRSPALPEQAACAGWKGEHKHRAFPSWRQSLRAATGLLETCYHSCDTDSVQEPTRIQCFVNFGPRRVTFVFMWNEIFDRIGEKLLPTKAAPIASLNLSIIHSSLSKNMT